MINATLHTKSGRRAITSVTWRDDILQRGYTAFIFDCDGTLVESADVHFTAFREAAKEQKYGLDRDWYFARTGLDRLTLFRQFAEQFASGFDIDAAVTRSISLFVEISDRVLPIVETKSLVKDFSRDFPLAVGTNAERNVAEASLGATGMLGFFNDIVSITDGLKPKPSPEIFERAAELLGCSREKTLVIEDSKQGVIAAQRAGLDVIEIKEITSP
ncbi:HAD family phosphatase [Aliiroseovarius sp. S1339]|uniref:HAD family hydrolase n=1 Tax=Aliiroseovarius sp. S1339 TaxID=2936990 RepID=UPI0020C1528F|nr:HAD family phosphatase [Aliiroseovarius sp. S1339]MCK8462942.1 HAD family phosphatase [Aliiroseovarius sp. S1339]